MPTLGTLPPVFIPKADVASLRAVIPTKNYFYFQFLNTHAAFFGRFFESAKNVVVTSYIQISRSLFDKKPTRYINCTREIKKNSGEELGLRNNLLDLLPANVSALSVKIEYLAKKPNNSTKITSLTNDQALSKALSSAPGASAGVQTFVGLVDKVLGPLMDNDGKEPILSFEGDFNFIMDDQSLKDIM